jgi:hypothetical protein
MEHSLAWSGVLLGGIGWLCGALLRRAGGREKQIVSFGIPRLFWVVAAALPLLVFLFTLPSRPPFAAGQGWGTGFLIGGLGALLAGWGALGTRSFLGTPAQAMGAIAGTCAMAVAAIGVPLLWMHGTILDGLTGAATGWFCVAFLILAGLLISTFNTEGEQRRREEVFIPCASLPLLTLVAGMGFAATLCAVVGLGVYRRPMSVGDVGPGAPWSSLALVYAAGIPFVLLLSALPNRLFVRMALKLPFARLLAVFSGRLFSDEEAREAAVRAWRLIFSLAVMLGLAKLLAVKAIPHDAIFYVAAEGMVAGLIAWWLLRDGMGFKSASRNAWLFPLAVMVLLTGCMAGFQMLAGYGVALAATGMWLAAGLALAGTVSQEDTPDQEERAATLMTSAHALTQVLHVGAVLALYRLSVTRFEADLRAASLSDFYALFGFLAGVALPALFSGLLLQADFASRGPLRILLRVVFTGLWVLVAPALIVALWGPKCVLTLLAGLALAGVAGRFSETSSVPRLPVTALITGLLGLGMALAIAQWTHLALPLASLTRAEKIRLLIWTLVILAGLVVGADYGGRMIGWWRRRRARSLPTARSEGVSP